MSHVDVWEKGFRQDLRQEHARHVQKKARNQVAGGRDRWQGAGVRAEGDPVGGWEGKAGLLKKLKKCLLDKVN